VTDTIADSVPALRLTVFFSVFFLLALFELLFPRRKLSQSKGRRWAGNLSVSVINAVLLRFTLPLAGVGTAVLAQEKNWGLLNQLELPAYAGILIFLLLFDFTIYWQHRLFHLVPILWRLHRMHHTDLDYDVTTGSRFHPASILLSAIIKIGLALVLGPSVVAILIAEILLNITSMFNHSNIYIPLKVDRVLRYFVVTPDMHRVHHSVDSVEHNHNFGFNFPWWDRLFGSYQDQPRVEHQIMKIGISAFQKDQSINLLSLLKQPFQK
jgi:sterol desaturase/sphingolipid hydroxylase (fatty acid hydroxylase superfamily)